MGPERRSFLRRPHAEDDTAAINPVDQLDEWRAWRTEGTSDTVEFPAVKADERYEPLRDEWSPAGGEEELETTSVNRRHVPRFGRPGSGTLVGGGLVAAALLLSGLVAVGVGPVRDLLGSGHDPSTTGTSRTAPGSSTSTTTGQPHSSSGSARGSGPAASGTPSRAAAPSAPAAGGDVPDAGPAAGGSAPSAPAATEGQAGPPPGPADGGTGRAAVPAGQPGHAGAGGAAPPVPNRP